MQEEQKIENLYSFKYFNELKPVSKEKLLWQDFTKGFFFDIEVRRLPRKHAHKITSVKIKKAFRRVAREFMLRHYKIEIFKTASNKIHFFKSELGFKSFRMKIIPMQERDSLAIESLHWALACQELWALDTFAYYYWICNTKQGMPYAKLILPKYEKNSEYQKFIQKLYLTK